MKKSLLVFVFGIMASSAVWASGFALYEPTAAGTAFGGALVGKAFDGSANSINPATLDDITNITVQIGFVTEHPRARIKETKYGATGRQVGKCPLDPGFFVLPHFQLVAPAKWGLVFGLGMGPEYGLGTHYTKGSLMTWSARETTIQGYVINPNLSYRITDKWSVGAGIRWIYFDFEQYSCPASYVPYPGSNSIENHLHGDNDFKDWGWQIGTRYKILDNLAVGAVYKSKIDVKVKGHSSVRNPMGLPLVPYAFDNGSAHAKLELPQSVAVGFNWDITDTWHLGAMASWTEWSSIGTLHFKLPPKQGNRDFRLKWKDSMRYAIAPSWDFAEDWTAVLSYIYDSNVCPSQQDSSMLPPGDRQIASAGLIWRVTENLEAALSYGIVVMGSNKSMTMNDPLGAKYKLECHRGLSHAAGFTLTYRF